MKLLLEDTCACITQIGGKNQFFSPVEKKKAIIFITIHPIF